MSGVDDVIGVLLRIHFADALRVSDVGAPMDDVPALGQYARALLIEVGLDSAAVDDALSAGVVRQAE